MRVGPPPLMPLYPVQPDKTEVYPKEPGAALYGKPFLQFPELKPQETKTPPAAKGGGALEGTVKASLGPKADTTLFLTSPKSTQGPAGTARSGMKPTKTLGVSLDFLA